MFLAEKIIKNGSFSSTPPLMKPEGNVKINYYLSLEILTNVRSPDIFINCYNSAVRLNFVSVHVQIFGWDLPRFDLNITRKLWLIAT